MKLIRQISEIRNPANGDIDISDMKLTVLPDDLPLNLPGEFKCNDNNLTSLKGSPTFIGEDFFCGGNLLKSLVGGPSSVGQTFGCSGGNRLTNLIGAPEVVGKNFRCRHVGLKSVEGAPKRIGGNFECSNNDLTSLHLIHTYVHEIGGDAAFSNNPIKSHVLGLLKIKNLRSVKLDNQHVAIIINKYLPLGDLFDCQEELIEAGFEEYAQL